MVSMVLIYVISSTAMYRKLLLSTNLKQLMPTDADRMRDCAYAGLQRPCATISPQMHSLLVYKAPGCRSQSAGGSGLHKYRGALKRENPGGGLGAGPGRTDLRTRSMTSRMKLPYRLRSTFPYNCRVCRSAFLKWLKAVWSGSFLACIYAFLQSL